MKIYYKLLAMFVGASIIIGFISCADDNDSNPTMLKPSSFKLNAPSISNLILDLQSEDSLRLTWSQPNFGFPAIVKYYVQYSPKGVFKSSVDEDSNVISTYVQEDEPLITCNASIATSDINRHLMELLNISSESETPAKQDVFFRISAQTSSSSVIYSDTICLQTAPYYQALIAADPILWYLTGSCIGDGSWSSDVPTGCLPMYFSQSETYDYATGSGIIKWAGYVNDGFKLRGSTTDNWATQIGQGSGFGDFVLNDGGSGNISVPSEGLYEVILDTKTNLLEIKAYENKVKIFDGISLSGSFNGWSDNELTPVTTVCENHDWYITISLAAGDEVKFKQTGSWDFNWGGQLSPLSYGYFGNGENNGYNLYIDKEGTYTIYFNDIEGLFRFERQ